MVYGDFKDLPRKTASDKKLHDKKFSVTKNPEYVLYDRGLASVVYKFFDKEFSRGAGIIEIILNQKLPEKLHKAVTGKFEKQKVHSYFIDNIGKSWSNRYAVNKSI